jgi:putative ABC transport system substrate-binding protein
MRRRDFIAGLGGVAAWPFAARGRQQAMLVIGYLGSSTPAEGTQTLEAIRVGLQSLGFVEGANLTIEYRWANNDSSRLPGLAADLVP